MSYQSKTYSLSDEVIAIIDDAKAKGESPNKFLRRVLGLDNGRPITRPGFVRLSQHGKVTRETRKSGKR